VSCTNPQAPPQPITVVRGESKTFLLAVRDSKTLQPVDLTGAKVWFTTKNRIEDINAIITKKNVTAGGVDGQILITVPQTGATMGQAQIFLDPADTAGLDSDASYWCDAWVQLATGKRSQVLSNRQFVVEPAVTTVFF
jgi:hypothetical protein